MPLGNSPLERFCPAVVSNHDGIGQMARNLEEKKRKVRSRRQGKSETNAEVSSARWSKLACSAFSMARRLPIVSASCWTWMAQVKRGEKKRGEYGVVVCVDLRENRSHEDDFGVSCRARASDDSLKSTAGYHRLGI